MFYTVSNSVQYNAWNILLYSLCLNFQWEQVIFLKVLLFAILKEFDTWIDFSFWDCYDTVNILNTKQ